jgi:hypothetical protein
MAAQVGEKALDLSMSVGATAIGSYAPSIP